MADGISKGIGEQLGQLGKQIVTDVVNVPAKISGMDTGTHESAGQGIGATKQQGQNPKQSHRPQVNPLENLRQKDEVERQKQLVQARRLLEQLMQPQQVEPSLKEKLETEDMEKKQKEIAAERKIAAKQLPQVATKPKSGNLFRIRSKQFGGEVGKNVKSQ